MLKKNQQHTKKYLDSIYKGIILSIFRTSYEQISLNNPSSDLQNLVQNLDIHSDHVYNFSENKKQNIYVDIAKNGLIDCFTQTLISFLGCVTYANISKDFLLLGILGGIGSYKIKEYFTQEQSTMDCIFGATDAILGGQIAKNYEDKIINDNEMNNEIFSSIEIN